MIRSHLHIIAVRAFFSGKEAAALSRATRRSSFPMDSCYFEAHVSARGQQADMKRIAVNASPFLTGQPVAYSTGHSQPVYSVRGRFVLPKRLVPDSGVPAELHRCCKRFCKNKIPEARENVLEKKLRTLFSKKNSQQFTLILLYFET